MGLNILPLPESLKSANPDWSLLVLIYWTLAIPERFGVFSAWFLGLFIDILTGRVLGMHGLTYAVVAYACLRLHKRLRQYPLLQQAFFVFLCLIFSQSLIFWIENIQNTTRFSFDFWLPVFTGTIVWPFVYFFCQFLGTANKLN